MKAKSFSDLGEALREWERDRAVAFKPKPDADGLRLRCHHPVGKVAGGVVQRRPIDKTAALVTSKAQWLHRPPPVEASKPQSKEQLKPKKPKRRKHTMGKSGVNVAGGMIETPIGGVQSDNFVSKEGIRCQVINGQTYYSKEDVQRICCEEVSRLMKELRPNVQAAQDARRIVDELTNGLGDEVDKFRALAKTHLEDIRAVRFTMVSEVGAMKAPLSDVRQFFMGTDYKDQINRLREFVDLCERLKALKDSGFLDNVADTMIRLAEPK